MNLESKIYIGGQRVWSGEQFGEFWKLRAIINLLVNQVQN